MAPSPSRSGWPPPRVAPPERRAAPALQLRENTLRTSRLSDASLCSHFLDAMDDLGAGGRIYRFCARLRALWVNFPVVVRVQSGALSLSL